ncbi:MAG: hypothetical protein AB2693_23345 [Candidatus Thiodiazotropha sp.]
MEVQYLRPDFESATHKAVQSIFPGINMQCCFFHLAQCHWR